MQAAPALGDRIGVEEAKANKGGTNCWCNLRARWKVHPRQEAGAEGTRDAAWQGAHTFGKIENRLNLTGQTIPHSSLGWRRGFFRFVSFSSRFDRRSPAAVLDLWFMRPLPAQWASTELADFDQVTALGHLPPPSAVGCHVALSHLALEQTARFKCLRNNYWFSAQIVQQRVARGKDGS